MPVLLHPLLLPRLLMLCLTGLVFYAVLFGQFPNIQQRAGVLAFIAALAVIVFPLRAAALPAALRRALDLGLLAAVLAAVGYVTWNYWDIMLNPGLPKTEALVLGAALVLCVLELARRTIGWTFAILAAVFAIYALSGHLLPGRIGHGGVSASMMVDMLFLSTDGLWGQVMDIFVTLLILFVLFSSLMMSTGAGQSMIDLAKLFGGRMRGGPAKIAVMSSAMVGSMTGSSVTNVAMTGNFTIPMMIRLGYRPAVAGGIEATASSGGQITPPLMGAGLFLMAEFLGIDLGRMMLIALVPAFLFYVGVLSSVHFESLRVGVGRLPPEELPEAARFRRFETWGPLLLPFAVLIGMVLQGFSVDLAIFAAILTLAAAHLAAARSLADLKARLRALLQALDDAVKPLVTLGALCAAAGILIGIIGFVGIGVKFADGVLGLAGGHLLPALLLAGVVVIVIGMGMPTTAAYILAVSVIATAFTQLGIPELSSHMFIFYFATLSAITPPVCAAVFVAAGLANAPWLATALHTVRFAAIKYLLPFLFIFRPELLLQADWARVTLAIALCALATVLVSAAFAGYLLRPLGPLQRALLLAGGALLLWPDLQVNLLATLPLGIALASNTDWRALRRPT